MSSGNTAHGAKALMASAAGYQDGLVDQGALGNRPHDGQLALGSQAGHLLGVERQVVAQHARVFREAAWVSTATSSSNVAMSSSRASRLCAIVASRSR